MKWQRYWKYHKRDIIRWAIVVAAALVVSLLVVVLSQILDKPFSVYYPHDESRRQQIQPFGPTDYPEMRTCEDEHKQQLEIIITPWE